MSSKTTEAPTARKAMASMIAVLLIGALGMAIAHYTISSKASATVTAEKISYNGQDVVSTNAADEYAAKVLDVRLAAATSTTEQVSQLLDERAAIQKADSLNGLAKDAQAAYQGCMVAGALLIILSAVSMARSTRRGNLSVVATA